MPTSPPSALGPPNNTPLLVVLPRALDRVMRVTFCRALTCTESYHANLMRAGRPTTGKVARPHKVLRAHQKPLDIAIRMAGQSRWRWRWRARQDSARNNHRHWRVGQLFLSQPNHPGGGRTGGAGAEGSGRPVVGRPQRRPCLRCVPGRRERDQRRNPKANIISQLYVYFVKTRAQRHRILTT